MPTAGQVSSCRVRAAPRTSTSYEPAAVGRGGHDQRAVEEPGAGAVAQDAVQPVAVQGEPGAAGGGGPDAVHRARHRIAAGLRQDPESVDVPLQQAGHREVLAPGGGEVAPDVALPAAGLERPRGGQRPDPARDAVGGVGRVARDRVPGRPSRDCPDHVPGLKTTLTAPSRFFWNMS